MPVATRLNSSLCAVRPFVPMPLRRLREPFDDPDWLVELKLDGQPALHRRRNRRSVDRASLDTPAHGSHERTIERRTQRLSRPPSQTENEVVVDGSDRVAFDDVRVIRDGLVLECRVGKRVVWVPPRRMLRGSTIKRAGDRGRLVLSRETALNLGLIWEPSF